MERFKKKMSTSGEGFTLIGVLTSTFIVVTVSLAAIGVLVRSEGVVDVSRERFIAISLAREGIELVRVVRDTNWVGEDNEGNWLAGGICEDENQEFNEVDHEVFADIDIVRTTGELSTFPEPALYRSEGGRWTHDPSNGEQTAYSRQISIDCSRARTDDQVITITSTVSWVSKGDLQEVVVRDQLYNWLASSS